MTDFTVKRIAFGSYMRFCCLLAANIGFVLALLFFLANDGRQMSLGSFYFYDAGADWMVFLFWLLSVTALTALLSLAAYPLMTFLLRLLGGIKMSGDLH